MQEKELESIMIASLDQDDGYGHAHGRTSIEQQEARALEEALAKSLGQDHSLSSLEQEQERALEEALAKQVCRINLILPTLRTWYYFTITLL